MRFRRVVGECQERFSISCKSVTLREREREGERESEGGKKDVQKGYRKVVGGQTNIYVLHR